MPLIVPSSPNIAFGFHHPAQLRAPAVHPARLRTRLRSYSQVPTPWCRALLRFDATLPLRNDAATPLYSTASVSQATYALPLPTFPILTPNISTFAFSAVSRRTEPYRLAAWFCTLPLDSYARHGHTPLLVLGLLLRAVPCLFCCCQLTQLACALAAITAFCYTTCWMPALVTHLPPAPGLLLVGFPLPDLLLVFCHVVLTPSMYVSAFTGSFVPRRFYPPTPTPDLAAGNHHTRF